jgi:hypothetical protein
MIKSRGAFASPPVRMSDTTPAEFKRPTQTDVALGVAKDVASDLIPAQYRPALIVAGVIIVAIILYLIFT